MKHLVWIAVLVTACDSTDGTRASLSNDSTVITEKKTAGSGGSCNNLIFFKSGAEIYAKNYHAAGKVMSSTHTKITDVKKEEGMMVAYVEASDTSNGNRVLDMKYNYKCDGKSIYFDLASMMRSTAQDQDAKFEASQIEYPIAVTAGQTLPDANGVMSMEKGGRKMIMKYRYKERKVEGKETITTPAGTWKCFKISNLVEVEMDFPGLDEKAKKMMQTMTKQNGKLQSRNEIVAVKR
jgi:hypothetical protein